MRLRSLGAVEAGVVGRESSSSDSGILERRPGRDAMMKNSETYRPGGCREEWVVFVAKVIEAAATLSWRERVKRDNFHDPARHVYCSNLKLSS